MQTHIQALSTKCSCITHMHVSRHIHTHTYAGTEHQVRVHNIVPGSSYRVRLRAGDFVDGEISTVVERCSLPFVTPSWDQMIQEGGGGWITGLVASDLVPVLQPLQHPAVCVCVCVRV